MPSLSTGSHSASFPTADQLMDEVKRKSGLSDFGPQTFREGLEQFLRHIKATTTLPEPYVNGLLDTARRRLTNRLEIEETIRLNPEIDSLPIEGPVSITGLPRTGTSALVGIMSQDTGLRTTRVWEQERPCPPPVLEAEANDSRRIAALENTERLLRGNPALKALHIFDVDASEEDHELLGLNFKAQQLAVPLFGYHAWWRNSDVDAAYMYHRRVLQLLQWRRPPNRWLLKCPAHMFHMDAIVSAYPNIRFVMTHRDPARVVPSLISLLVSFLPPGYAEKIDMGEFNRHHREHFRVGILRAIEARARIGEDRFFDVYHRDFVSDPFGTLERVFAFIGIELRPKIRKIMERWHAENHSGAHGEHKYTPKQFGYSADEIRSEFDFYIKRFDVPLG